MSHDLLLDPKALSPPIAFTMTKVEEEKGAADGRDEYTEDGSVDLKGRPVLRSNTGRWKACSFIVGYEVFERMAYYGIASNLVLYLSRKLHEGTVKASNNVNIWVGTVWMTPIVGAYIADAFLGRYWTFVIASAIYLTGMSLLTLAVSLPALRPPSCGHGIKEEACNKRASDLQKGVFYCALYIIAIGTGGTKPNISTMGADQFDDFAPKERLSFLCRFLDKAAVKSGSNSPWMLCPLTQVEETKQMVKMIPVLSATFIPSTLLAQVGTLFIKQGTTLDRRMGPHFEIPAACLTAFVTIFMLISIPVYDRIFVPTVRRYTKNPRGITLLQRMGIGLVLQIIIMVVACFAERKRLSVARKHQIVGKDDTVPLTIFILLPQFALMGVADSLVEVAKLEFFYDQAPDGMKSLGTSYFTSSLGIGHFLGSSILTTVSDITMTNGHKGWILDNLNISHLDYYYAFLAAMGSLNFIFFLIVAKYFVYNVDVTERDLKEAIEASLDKTSLKGEALATGPI
ncbi:hypothetical protein E1A91_A07G165700v1 [Gossypium mustelinum]|uniref:Major facilitator superfamily (MFS) profile domain-containing protein n=1 Tax=Gossypium mustelinum TaxID=34275 RepID=A0A5D2YMA4_GOSMU|nr:hypothetical protein E1A91_A07G165700v1 [Gossypium mustelinum]